MFQAYQYFSFTKQNKSIHCTEKGFWPARFKNTIIIRLQNLPPLNLCMWIYGYVSGFQFNFFAIWFCSLHSLSNMYSTKWRNLLQTFFFSVSLNIENDLLAKISWFKLNIWWYIVKSFSALILFLPLHFYFYKHL